MAPCRPRLAAVPYFLGQYIPAGHGAQFATGRVRARKDTVVVVSQASRRTRSESEFDELFDLSPDLCCVVGFDGRIKRANPTFERTLGLSNEELLSGSTLDFVHPDDAQASRDVLRGLAAGERLTGLVHRLICADSSVRWIEWHLRGVPEKGVAYCVGRDVTERRRADLELRALADTQAALKRVATMVARASPADEVFAKVAEEVGLLLEVDTSAIERYEQGGYTTIVGSWGRAREAFPVGSRWKPDRGNPSELVYRTGRPIRVDGYERAAGGQSMRARKVGLRGTVVGSPILVNGRLWGMVSAATSRAEPMPEDAESRIAEFGDLVATAISNLQARSDLAASRARVAATADEERRRVVRDLHDGAQQRLVHAVVTLKIARRALEQEDPAKAAELLTEGQKQAECAIDELRKLAHGILPAVLTHGGLLAGVRELASRMSIPVEIDVSLDGLQSAVEATAYFVVAEALTNVAKHSHAQGVEVTARTENGMLHVRIRDDGVGGAQQDKSGLVGIRDRLAALDGRLHVESPPGHGTIVAAQIPLRTEIPVRS